MNDIQPPPSTSFASIGSVDGLSSSLNSSSNLSINRTAVSHCSVSTPGFCCDIEVALDTYRQELTANHLKYSENLLSIVDAQIAHDGSGSSYIAYVIRRGDRELKRRYSEFNSLRKCLQTLYPALIVPPIPEKHTLTDYATKQNRAKQDPQIIEKRKRMLQCFLNRVGWHPILSTDHLFHRFLQPGILWADILHSTKVTTLPKTKPPSLASSLLPAPQVKHPDPKFVEVEAFTLKFEAHIKDLLEKTHRKMMRRYNDLSSDYGDLAAIYNAFSTTESGAVSNAVEKIGIALEVLQSTTMKLFRLMEEGVTEPLHEYSQFSEVIKVFRGSFGTSFSFLIDFLGKVYEA
ncbi:Sorting nexin, cytoplasm-to-vacuole targeting pathway/endosomal sorting [Coelomomyces lativittatus]|nr:Sorting nexin, cytoplasm-to-vacuole targeting pathway/endosomal sorting [Coelomomyces lativittatus]